jgi:hypothetical protein
LKHIFDEEVISFFYGILGGKRYSSWGVQKNWSGGCFTPIAREKTGESWSSKGTTKLERRFVKPPAPVLNTEIFCGILLSTHGQTAIKKITQRRYLHGLETSSS